MSLPENTYDLTCRVRVTLPEGQTPEEVDMGLTLTGGEFDPWPGVEIHDVDLLDSAKVQP